ncbi:hypothetical protein AMS68_003219 [Peltaster fructicola]|uniref:PLD phosphodiesterase domain-containing protein n=1 Tax=Peltaster fructicola TaxID=286661 RepID=A0A6H0XSF5_9PEZI|nr:hypothetical protein AMS68_003219 [Peltaster fructicola]
MTSKTHITDKLLQQCASSESVSALLAKDPTLAPHHAISKLYHPEGFTLLDTAPPHHRAVITPEELERAYQCGKWGPTRPSELFLQMFHESLLPLQHDPLMGVCSPSMLGSCGVVPLTVISALPDICRHMSNLIARAEKEVFLATNFWMDGESTWLITDALRELSKRAGQRGEKAVVKILYDRGNLKQFVDNHQVVPEKTYTGKAIKLPSKDEIPHIELEVVNYHRPLLGTFHSKFMVVDRKYGVISSNNIQDNDNVEMMCHVEGPIVDSLYDTALISWHNAMKPPLPSHNTPAADGGIPAHERPSFHALFDEHGEVATRNAVPQNQSTLETTVGETGTSRSLTEVEAAGEKVDLPIHTGGDPHYDPDIAAEVTRMQSVLTPHHGEMHNDVVCRHLNRATHQDTKKSGPECAHDDEMTPMIPHNAQALVPMALVNRKPYGAANNHCIYTPQNEAWLAGLRYAKKSVFIQTPDLNYHSLLDEIKNAVKRGIEVTYIVCLGYNDAGELLPGQGGHNEMVASKLCETLSSQERSNLHILYYVGKDQDHPIHNKFKARSCHIKLMIVDEHVGIIGNGNQDTQSWCHSQEVNVMLDSADICQKWMVALRRNQNSFKYGAADDDGVWRGKDGKEAEGAIGKDPGKFGWAKGIVGAVQRVRGAGGF